MKPTTECRALAERMIGAVMSRDVNALARVLGQIHDRACSCSVVRVEREFAVRARKRAPGERR